MMFRFLAYLLTGSFALASSDAPVDLMMVLETSPGMEQVAGLLNPRALEKNDRAAVRTISGRSTQTPQPLTDDRDAIASALRKAGMRLGVAIGKTQVDLTYAIDIATGIEQSCEELESKGLSENRRAILLVFGTDDPGLETRLNVIRSILSSTRTRLYAVVIDRSLSQPVTPPGSINYRRPGFPVLTVQRLQGLVTESGGRLYRRAWDLKEILKEIRKSQVTPASPIPGQ